jgi:type VI secretion system secreted protein Hcp
MAIPAYLYLEGEKQGKIEGSVDIEGHVGSILVQAFNHAVVTPTDIQTGQPTGKRMHKDLKVLKFYDKSSPMLYQALCSGERMKTVTIKWYRIKPDGTEEHYFTHKLESATLTKIEASMANCLDPANGPFGHMEEVSMTYRKIIWTWEPDGVESEDDWQRPQG